MLALPSCHEETVLAQSQTFSHLLPRVLDVAFSLNYFVSTLINYVVGCLNFGFLFNWKCELSEDFIVGDFDGTVWTLDQRIKLAQKRVENGVKRFSLKFF